MAPAEISQRQLAGERRNAERTARQVRRTPFVVLGILEVLVLAVGVTAAVDLRRLDTPAGAAQSWVQAALVGDCERFRLLSVAATPDSRTTTRLCQDLRAAARDRLPVSVRTRVRVQLPVEQEGPVARVVVELQPDGEPAVTRRLLLTDDGRWRVVRDADACALVRCP